MTNAKTKRRIEAGEAFTHYLALGEGRSLPKLRAEYEGMAEIITPSMSALKTWSREHGWTAKAGQWDADVLARVSRQVAEGAVKQHIDLAKRMRGLADTMLTKAEEVIKTVDSKSAHQLIGPLVEGAISLTKQAAVTEGGVSDRVSALGGKAAEDEQDRTAEDYRSQALESLKAQTGQTTH